MPSVILRDGRHVEVQVLGLRVAGFISRPFKYRGMQPTTWKWGRYFPPANRVAITTPGGQMWVNLDDGYWIKLILPGYEYEPEVRFLLRRLLALEGRSAFLDCGANIGYWSIEASSMLPRQSVLSVEASPLVFSKLVENARLNGDRFQCRQAAVWSVNDEELRIGIDKVGHAGNSVVSSTGFPTAPVMSVTIDSLAAELDPQNDCRLLIKLDVEGAEVQALEGAQQTISERAPIFIYEDHASDPRHLPTRHLMKELGFRVFLPDEAGGLSEIESVDELGRIKRDRFRGYNFVAASPSNPVSRLLESAAKSGNEAA